MSEAARLLGASAPGRTIEHNGKTYTFVAALSNEALTAFEALLYDRARAALAELREDYPVDEYLKRLDELRGRYEAGYYAFTGPQTQEFIQTPKGGVLLLQALCGGDEGEVFDLLSARAEEVMRVVEDVAAATFPDRPEGSTDRPKARPRPTARRPGAR